MKAEQPYGPLRPLSLDHETGDLSERGVVIPQPLTVTQRTYVRALRESGVDFYCYLANIKLLGVVRAHYLWGAMAE